MSVQRHIRQLNALLLSELGTSPPYQWIWSESAEFKHAYRCLHDDGTLKFNFTCPCGLNTIVHTAECEAGQLVVAHPVFEVRKVNPDLTNQWVLCRQQPLPTRLIWERMFGTLLPYPEHGTWAPLSKDGPVPEIMAMPPDALPGRNFTIGLIRACQRSREQPSNELDADFTARDERKHRQRRAKLKDMVKEHVYRPFALHEPGKRGGAVSWGGIDSATN